MFKQRLTIKTTLLLLLSLAAVLAGPLRAGEADVVDVTITKEGESTFRINATLLHEDTGWDHYADRWDVVAPDGTVLGSRVLHHPHVNEQPFTRSLTLTIPPGITTVTIQAHDSVHKLGGKTFQITVPH